VVFYCIGLILMDELHYRLVHDLAVALCNLPDRDGRLLFSFCSSVLQLTPLQLMDEIQSIGANYEAMKHDG